MANDNSAPNNPGQSLKTIVQLTSVENFLSRLFNHGVMFTKKTDTPAIHVFFGLYGKNRQEFRS
jgi:hypothetical protein